MTFPLITKADGSKFGKTETGTVWLDSKKTSYYAFYQFWLTTSDSDVYAFLRYFTFLDEYKIKEIEKQDNEALGKKEGQMILAQEVTQLVHGALGLDAAKRITDALFSSHFEALSEKDFTQLAYDGLPTTRIKAKQSYSLIQLLVDSGLAMTPNGGVTVGQARKLIKSNAISLNGIKTKSLDLMLLSSMGYFEKYLLLKKGKKMFHLLVWNEE
jgi:tyrosyl-tRNA synthetase